MHYARPLLALLAVFMLALLAVFMLAPAQAGQDDLLGGTASSGCGVGMSCPQPDPVPLGCVNNDIGNPCGVDSGPASQAAPAGQNVGAGNPLSLVSGNKHQKEVDLPALPGVLGLEIVRHYNSLAARGRGAGPLGRGWRLSYDTALFALPGSLQIVQADGTRVIFSRDPAHPHRCASADPARGEVLILPKRGGDEYVWVWPEGRRLYFDAAGRLVQISAPTGEFVALQRAPDGALVKVTDPQGRSLVVAYHGPEGGGLGRIAHLDSPVGRFSYHYDADGAERLVKVTLPTHYDPDTKPHPFANRGTTTSTLARAYHYEDARHPGALTGITVSGAGSDGVLTHQRLATWVYDEAGRAIRAVGGALPPEGERGIDDVTLDFSLAGETRLTNSLGQQTRYLTQLVASERRLLEARGPGCARCGPTNVRYRYDAAGRLTATTTLDAAGRPLVSQQTEFDAASRPVKVARLDLSGKQPRLIDWVRYEYAPTPAPLPAGRHADPATFALPAPRPVLVARPSVVPGREHRWQLGYNDAGQLLSVTETGYAPALAPGAEPTPLTRTTTFRYTTVNGRSLLAEVDGPLPNGPTGAPSDSDITRFEWDGGGDFPVRLTAPGGIVTRVVHDRQTGQLSRVEGENGSYTAFDFNALRQLTELRSGGPGWTHPLVRSYRYDALGRRIESGRGAGEVYEPLLRQAFDVAGRPQWQASALGFLSAYRHDTENRLVEARQASATMMRVERYRYDEAGRLAEVSDNAGRSRRVRYDGPRGAAIYTDALGREFPLRAVPAPSPDTRTDTSAARTLRDDFGRALRIRSPNAGEEHRVFDEADRLVAMLDARGHRAQYAYDGRGRILRQVITDGQSGEQTVTRWHYDGARLFALRHPTQGERYRYDERGLRTARIVTLPTAGGEITATTRYEHDADGRLVATILPDGSRIEYRRNGQGQVVEIVRTIIRTPWLRWLAPSQTLVRDIERDLVGLRAYVAGNGVESRYQRSAEGILARVVHRHLEPARPMLAGGHAPLARLGDPPREIAERILGIAAAQASPAGGARATPAARVADPPRLPGALALPPDSGSVLDFRYLWDPLGNLLYQQRRDGTRAEHFSHAYDGRDRLISTVATNRSGDDQRVWRYAYDAYARRVLAQEGAPSQADLETGTVRTRFAAGTHHRADLPYTPSGQPLETGAHTYAWDALGRLREVRSLSGTIARYDYDHRGLRNAKTVGAKATRYLHDAQRRLLAELDAHGRLTRQYLYLADLPLAVIDTPDGRPLAPLKEEPLESIAADLVRIAQSWFGDDERLVWLHANHLGAPEAATDAAGNVLWRADYAPFGAARVEATDFTLHLRLPGQYFDPETGLHYNRQRYYHPGHGQYLSPDPLGTPDGPNPYAYVAFNPLRFVDPNGLVLFAFDGTGNTDDVSWLWAHSSSPSNVVLFRDLYDDGRRRYISGVGTLDRSDPARPIDPADYKPWYIPGSSSIADMGGNYSGPARIERMVEYFREEADNRDDRTPLDVDIVGFSRGAAQARDFANRIAADTVDGWYRYSGALGEQRCQQVNLRFLGLWDTVLSTNLSGNAYNLHVPAGFAYIAQAIALNEHRGRTLRRLPGSIGAFPVESILGGDIPAGQSRVEMGFLGSHADIGGGFGENESQLARVALVWMVEQAGRAGVDMHEPPRTIIANPVLHDKSDNLYCGSPARCSVPYGEDRQVRYLDGSSVAQKAATGAGMSFIDTQDARLVSYLPTDEVDEFGTPVRTPRGDFVTGTVNMTAYLAWLDANGYGIGLSVAP